MHLSAGDFFGCVDKPTYEETNDISGGLDLTASILSMIGSSFVIVHYLLWDKRKLIISRLVFLLSLADLGSSVSILVSEAWLLAGSEYPTPICVGLRTGFEYFGVASWIWTGCIAYYAFHNILVRHDLFFKECKKNEARDTKIIMVIFHVLSWGVPAPLCILLLAAGVYERSEGGWCHPKQPWQMATWMAPLVGIFIFNAILSVIIVISLKVQAKYTTPNITRQHLSWRLTVQLLMFLGAYFICWVPDVAFHVLSVVKPSCYLIWLGLFQNFLAPLQGFLNCIVYGLSKSVRHEYKWYMLIVWILISPLLVGPTLISYYVALLTFNKVNFLRYISTKTRMTPFFESERAEHRYMPISINAPEADDDTSDTYESSYDSSSQRWPGSSI